MTDLITDIENAFARVEAHIKLLIEGGAPHQQEHAKDLQVLVDTAKGAPVGAAIGTTEVDNLKAQVATLTTDLETANSKLANLQGNIDNLMTVRDSLQGQLDTATAKNSVLETQLETAKSPLSAASASVGGRDAATGEQVAAATQP